MSDAPSLAASPTLHSPTIGPVNPWRPISTFDQEDGIDVDVWVEVAGAPWLSIRIPDVMRVNGEWFWKSGAFMAKIDHITHWMPRPPKPEGEPTMTKPLSKSFTWKAREV